MLKKILTPHFLHTNYAFVLVVFLFLSCKGKNDVNSQQANADTTSQSANNTNDVLFTKYELDKVKLPPGFKISVFAEVPSARSLSWGGNGTLFAGTRGDKVYAIVDTDKNGKADKVYTIASGLNSPNGVAFRNGSLYVAEINRVLRFDDIENNLENPPAYKVVYDKLPKDGHHGWKFIAFGPDDKLYVPVGAPCNVCKKEEPVYSTITRMNADGTGFEIFAKGIRNTVGFSWHPQTKELWFTDNGRDELGDNVPSDELNTAPKAGMDFGFPYCHQGDILDPEFGKGKNCSDYTPPAFKLGPHVASLGMRFYTGQMFPAEYQNQIFVAEHGSWNRSNKIGYNITLVKLENNKVIEAVPFATGWLQPDEKTIGRPVDIIVASDGALLVSDDTKGAIYRINYEE
jgi:glucose/arabinose dehydrogenase